MQLQSKRLVFDEIFKRMCKEIVLESKSVEEWASIESDDMFSTGNYEGGFDATENAFCFSYHSGEGVEYWFQLGLGEVEQVVNGYKVFVEMRPAS